MSRSKEFDPVRWANAVEILNEFYPVDAEKHLGDGVGVQCDDGTDYCYACYGFNGSVPPFSWNDAPTSGDSFTCTSCGRTFAHVKRDGEKSNKEIENAIDEPF